MFQDKEIYFSDNFCLPFHSYVMLDGNALICYPELVLPARYSSPVDVSQLSSTNIFLSLFVVLTRVALRYCR